MYLDQWRRERADAAACRAWQRRRYPAAVPTTALAWDDLVAVLKNARARVVVFLDACHSGAAGTGRFATNDTAVQGLLDQIPSGLLVFSASKGRQFSEEMAQLGGGVFSNAVADVIARKRGSYDLDDNGAIEASELYAGVKRRVSELTDGRQVPWLARNKLIGDFSLLKLRETTQTSAWRYRSFREEHFSKGKTLPTAAP